MPFVVRHVMVRILSRRRNIKNRVPLCLDSGPIEVAMRDRKKMVPGLPEVQKKSSRSSDDPFRPELNQNFLKIEPS